MPTYEYVCDACGHEYEVFHSIKDDPLKKCPKCKKSKLRRKLGVGGGFIFKGSGFYITDYRSDSYKDAAKKDSGTATPVTTSEKGSEKSTEKGAEKSSDTSGGKRSEKDVPAKAKPVPAASESKGTDASRSAKSKPTSDSRRPKRGD